MAMSLNVYFGGLQRDLSGTALNIIASSRFSSDKSIETCLICESESAANSRAILRMSIRSESAQKRRTLTPQSRRKNRTRRISVSKYSINNSIPLAVCLATDVCPLWRNSTSSSSSNSGPPMRCLGQNHLFLAEAMKWKYPDPSARSNRIATDESRTMEADGDGWTWPACNLSHVHSSLEAIYRPADPGDCLSCSVG